MRGRASVEPGQRSMSGRQTPMMTDSELTRRFDKLQSQHSALQAEVTALRDVLAAREREVDVLRKRCQEAENEAETLRDELSQAQHRISTLLEMGQPGLLGSDDEHGDGDGDRDWGSSEEASMTFDKVRWRGIPVNETHG